MKDLEARAETYYTLAKMAVGNDLEAILGYCKFMGATDEILTLVEKKHGH